MSDDETINSDDEGGPVEQAAPPPPSPDDALTQIAEAQTVPPPPPPLDERLVPAPPAEDIVAPTSPLPDAPQEGVRPLAKSRAAPLRRKRPSERPLPPARDSGASATPLTDADDGNCPPNVNAGGDASLSREAGQAIEAEAAPLVIEPDPSVVYEPFAEGAHSFLDEVAREEAALQAEEEKDDLPTAAANDSQEPPLDDVTRQHLRGLLEALIFASDKPIRTAELAKSAAASLRQVRELLTGLKRDYEHRGVVLDEVAGGWIFRTGAAYAPFVRDLTQRKPVRLSRAQVETLAILAYRQPVTRPEIDEIRGVDSGATLKLLLDRDLIRIMGKKEEAGRPLLYGTTTAFLEFFGLKSLKELPTLREFTELTDDSKRVYDDEMGAEEEKAAAGPPGPAAPPVDPASLEDPAPEPEPEAEAESEPSPVEGEEARPLEHEPDQAPDEGETS